MLNRRNKGGLVCEPGDYEEWKKILDGLLRMQERVNYMKWG